MKHLNHTFRLLLLSLAFCLLLGLGVLAAESEDIAASTVYGFGDIAGHEYEDDIRLMYEMGYAVGYTDGSFRPGRAFTRLEAAQLSAGLLGLTAEEDSENPFLDTVDIAGSDAVSAAVSGGYMTGRSADSFDPYGSVLKAEFMSLMSKIAAFLGTEDLVSRLDETDALWAEDFSILTAAEAMHAACAMLEALDLPDPEAETETASEEMPSEEMPSEEMPADDAQLPEPEENEGLAEGETVTLNFTLTAPAEETESDLSEESEETADAGQSEETEDPAVTDETAETEESEETETTEDSAETEEAEEPDAAGEADMSDETDAAEATAASGEPSAEPSGEITESPAEPAPEEETAEDEPEAPQGVLAPAATAPQAPTPTEAPLPVQPAATAQPQQIPVPNQIPANPTSTALPEIDPDDPGAQMKSSIYSFYADIRDQLVAFFVDLLG